MAEDKNKNEDPEEERDDQFDDDEDFGLPDLEYDELDDEDDEDLMDEEPFEDEPEAEEPISEEPVAEEPEPVEEESFDDINEEDLGDFDDSETEDWEKELEKELEDELKSEAESPGFYEEESFDEFDSEVSDAESTETSASVFDSDDDTSETFDDGIEYSEETESVGTGYGTGRTTTPPPPTPTYQYDQDSGSGKGKFVRTVVIGTLLFATIALVFYLIYDGGSDEPKKKVAKKETVVPVDKPAETEPEPVKEEPKVEPKKAEPKKPAPKQPKANTKPAGEITSLSERTGKTYVIVGSFFDDDIANDFAKELSVDGKSPMVIPPFGESRFYRVAIAEFETFKDAQASLDGYKSEYGQDVWPLRY
ncbi:MAG: SPOR domain-containing protein [Marinoscillum sp.]